MANPSTSLESPGGSEPDYVKADFGSLQKVTQIRVSQTGVKWIEGFYLYFSQNDFDWAMYMEDGQRKVRNNNFTIYIVNVKIEVNMNKWSDWY